MSGADESFEVRDNPEAGRFEARVGEHLAIAAYRRAPGRITFTHTEVPPALQGHGVASRLIRAALDAARAEGAEVVPYCPFVADYIRRHPDYRELVPDRYRRLVS